jgi:hypothetical protein
MPRARNDSEARAGDEPSASVSGDQQAGEPGRSERVTLPEAPISRVIEYFPPGETVIGRDCTYGGATYSKGIELTMGSPGESYVCSGDKNGTWVKASK